MINICKFTFVEKFSSQFAYNAGVIVAAYGLYLHHVTLALAYLLYAYVSIFLLVRYTICPRCLHLLVAGDCLNLPPSIMKRIISKNRRGPLDLTEKVIFVSALYGTLIIPLYWLSSHFFLLCLFIVLFGGNLVYLNTYFCRNCANQECIQNRNDNLNVKPI
ncbi:MAG: hypothetical protein HKM93_21875 [Desulfobacteraceae bacterium]|nr:hypothetical protein [Desulfobacteraceae bacterium]